MRYLVILIYFLAFVHGQSVATDLDGNDTYRDQQMTKLPSDLENYRLITGSIADSYVASEYPYMVSGVKPPSSTSNYYIDQIGLMFLALKDRSSAYCYAFGGAEAPKFAWVGSNPVTGDFNGDGLEDMMFMSGIGPHVTPMPHLEGAFALTNDGQGNLAYDTSVFAVGAAPTSFGSYRGVSGDFNNDGVDDVIYRVVPEPQFAGPTICDFDDRQTQGQATIYLLSDTDRKLHDVSFSHLGTQSAINPLDDFGAWHSNPSAADFNGDGNLDLWTGRFLFLNDGTGHLILRNDLVIDLNGQAGFTHSSTVGDFDGDGAVDIAAGIGYGHTVYAVMFNDGNGDFTVRPMVTQQAGPYFNETPGQDDDNSSPNSMAAGDLNGDGIDDLVIAFTQTENYYQGRYYMILIGDGAGGFKNETNARISNIYDVPEGGGEGLLILRDADNDGDLDLVDHSVAFNEGNGNFAWAEGSVVIGSYYVNGSYLPKLLHKNIVGWDQRPDSEDNTSMNRAFPINIDNQGLIDWVSWVEMSADFTTWNYNGSLMQNEHNQTILYTIKSRDSGDVLPSDATDSGSSETAAGDSSEAAASGGGGSISASLLLFMGLSVISFRLMSRFINRRRTYNQGRWHQRT